VASNTSNMQGPDAFGPFASLGHNLVGKTDGSSGWTSADLTGTIANPLDAKLGALGNHGGPTLTIPLLAGSKALDAGDPALAPPADQRGVSRGATPNIGAFEATAATLVVSGPVNVTASQPFNVTVVASDPYGETAVGYTGTVDLYSTDDQAPFLGEYAFTMADGGQHIFPGVVLYTPGLQTISALDNSGLSGSYDLLVGGGTGPSSTSGDRSLTSAQVPLNALPGGQDQAARPVPLGSETGESLMAGAALAKVDRHELPPAPLDRLGVDQAFAIPDTL
jgi:hypothetical protein